MLIGPDEHFLGYVLRLAVVAGQPGGSRKNHVLIGTHKCRELGRKLRLHWNVCSFRNKTPPADKSCGFSLFGEGLAPFAPGRPGIPHPPAGSPAEPIL